MPTLIFGAGAIGVASIWTLGKLAAPVWAGLQVRSCPALKRTHLTIYGAVDEERRRRHAVETLLELRVVQVGIPAHLGRRLHRGHVALGAHDDPDQGPGLAHPSITIPPSTGMHCPVTIFASSAKASISQAIDANPGVTDKNTWVTYYYRGICEERSKQWNKAEADMRKALELQPEQPHVLNYLGYSWIDQGINLDEGMKMIKRAVDDVQTTLLIAAFLVKSLPLTAVRYLVVVVVLYTSISLLRAARRRARPRS